jgi:hypothetical protein
MAMALISTKTFHRANKTWAHCEHNKTFNPISPLQIEHGMIINQTQNIHNNTNSIQPTPTQPKSLCLNKTKVKQDLHKWSKLSSMP